MHNAAVSAKATAMMTCVANNPNQRTNRGVKNADSAVPTMPMPNTPVAKPRRAGSYQLLANGMPTAKMVPAMPRKKPQTSRSGYEPANPAAPTASTGAIDANEIAMNIVRPPNRSVSAPTKIRPTDPTRIGVATSIEASVLLRDRSPAYVVDSGPIMFQAQKLMAETHVASARFTPCRAFVSGVVAVLT